MLLIYSHYIDEEYVHIIRSHTAPIKATYSKQAPQCFEFREQDM